MDLIDDAQAREAQFLHERIAEQRLTARLDAPGNKLCVDCACKIPPARRRALPSAVRCVECQQWTERRTNTKNNNRRAA